MLQTNARCTKRRKPGWRSVRHLRHEHGVVAPGGSGATDPTIGSTEEPARTRRLRSRGAGDRVGLMSPGTDH